MIKTYTRVIVRSIILFTAMMVVTYVCQSQNTFLKTLGGVRSDEMHDMIRSHDGGFIMAGNTESYGQGNFGVTDDYVVKTDSDGNVLWSKTLGLQSYDDIFWIEPVNDSGYVICGVASDNDTSIGILLAKISESGNILWQKVLEQDHAGIGYCIRQTSDGGFIVAAEILQLDNLDFLLIKTDENGDVQWSKQVGSPEPDIPNYIMQTADGGYLACGVSRQNSATIPPYIVKTDSLGNVQWQKTYNTSPVFSRSTVRNVISTADGGYLLAGGNTNNQLFSDIILLKIDSAGVPQWVKSFGGNAADEFCGSIIQNGNGNFVVCGTSASSETDNFDALVMLIDSEGNLIHSALFGTTSADDEFVSVLPLDDGGYMLGGNTSSFSQFHFSDFMIMRIDKNFNGPQCDTLTPNIFEGNVFLSGTSDVSESAVSVSENDVIAVIDSGVSDSLRCNVATGEELPPPVGNVLSFYPNPAVSDLTFSGNYDKVVRIEVYNALGIKISSVPFTNHVNVAELADGYYFIRFLSGGGEVLKSIGFVKQ